MLKIENWIPGCNDKTLTQTIQFSTKARPYPKGKHAFPL